MTSHMTPGTENLVSMFESINGLNGLAVFTHRRGKNDSINATSSILTLKGNKIILGPKSEGAPVVVTKLSNRGSFSGVLIEITHYDDVFMGVTNGKIGEFL